jgi:hypothetical protein
MTAKEIAMWAVVGGKNFEVYVDGKNIRMKPTRKKLVIPK